MTTKTGMSEGRQPGRDAERAAVCATFEAWLARQYPGTRWVAGPVERPKCQKEEA